MRRPTRGLGSGAGVVATQLNARAWDDRRDYDPPCPVRPLCRARPNFQRRGHSPRSSLAHSCCPRSSASATARRHSQNKNGRSSASPSESRAFLALSTADRKIAGTPPASRTMNECLVPRDSQRLAATRRCRPMPHVRRWASLSLSMARSRSRNPRRFSQDVRDPARTSRHVRYAPSDLGRNHEPFRIDVLAHLGKVITHATRVIREIHQSLHNACDTGIRDIGLAITRSHLSNSVLGPSGKTSHG